MERKIGEEFDIKIRVRTVESSDGRSCTICALSDVCNADMFIQNISICDPAVRTDGKNIYYELVSYEES